MNAHLTLTDAGGLVAKLETGDRIVATDSGKMAEQLRLAGVTAESLTVANWKDDPDHAPLSGQIVAIKTALRAMNIPELMQIDTLYYKNLTVAVMRVADPNAPFYKGPIVCASSLPEDLAKAFYWGWQLGAACPGYNTAYLHDFVGFMERKGKGWNGDWTGVVAKYLWKPSEALELHRQEIRDAVQRFGMANPRVTGAALRYEDAIDLDLLVDPVSPTIATDIPELQTYLSKLLGVPVNIIVPGSLPQLARATALAEAKPV